MKDEDKKRKLGQYFTQGNCFELPSFQEWFEIIPKDNKKKIIEPFAGQADIPRLLNEAGYRLEWSLFDICPTSPDIKKNNSILSCPSGVIITNPPYLAKNSATRRKISFPETEFDDLYKLAMSKMLEKNDFVAAIIPESFITSELFLDRLFSATSIKNKMFTDTECPVCLACFCPENNHQKIYSGDTFIGHLHELKKLIPKTEHNTDWEFNNPEGQIGLIAIDNTKTASIQFILGEEINSNDIKISSRAKTRIETNREINIESLLLEANKILKKFRKKTSDVFLTSFKGLRKDGEYRRRLDFKIARAILNCADERILKNAC